VARKTPRVACTNMSLVKVRSSRGENWLLASCRVTTVRENVNEVTVIRELETASRTVRAAPASPPKVTADNQSGRDPSTAASRCGSANPTTSAATTDMTGSGHSRERTASLNPARGDLTTAPRRRHPARYQPSTGSGWARSGGSVRTDRSWVGDRVLLSPAREQDDGRGHEGNVRQVDGQAGNEVRDVSI